jgi:hypothetical protein
MFPHGGRFCLHDDDEVDICRLQNFNRDDTPYGTSPSLVGRTRAQTRLDQRTDKKHLAGTKA